MPGWRAAESIVARQVEDHQHRAIEIAAPLEVFVVAAQVDHRADVGELVQLVDVPAASADEDRAGRGEDPAKHRPLDAFHLHVAFLGQLGQLIEQLGIGQRHQGVGRIVEAGAIGLLQQVAEPPAGGPVLDRMPHHARGRHHRIEVPHQLGDLAAGERGQRFGVACLGLDHRLLDHQQRLLGRGRRVEATRLLRPNVHLLPGGGQGAVQSQVVAAKVLVQRSRKLLRLRRRVQHVAHQVVVPTQAAVAGDLRRRVDPGRAV